MTALPKDWLHLLPRKWTLAAIQGLPEDSRTEVIDGALIVNPSPTPLHQRISVRLTVALEAAAAEGWQVAPGVDVLLAEEPLSYLTPDVVVFDGSLPLTTLPIPCEAVLLVVEVVSKGSRSQDRGAKPLVYAEAGIPHYWRVETRQSGALATTVHTFVLDDGRYARTGEHSDRLALTEPIPVDLKVAGLTE